MSFQNGVVIYGGVNEIQNHFERRRNVTKSEFVVECVKRTIEPNVALENENLCDALREQDDTKVLDILDTEF